MIITDKIPFLLIAIHSALIRYYAGYLYYWRAISGGWRRHGLIFRPPFYFLGLLAIYLTDFFVPSEAPAKPKCEDLLKERYLLTEVARRKFPESMYEGWDAVPI